MSNRLSRLENPLTRKPVESVFDIAPEPPPPPPPPAFNPFLLRMQIQHRLEAFTKGTDDVRQTPHLDRKIELCVEDVLTQGNYTLKPEERQTLLVDAKNDVLSYGLLQPLLEDDSITEIMVNGPREIFVERAGMLEPVPATFESEAHVVRLIERMAGHVGRRIDAASPMVNARLAQGYRLNAIIRPLAVDGPVMTIRKFARKPFTVQDLINNQTITTQGASFLKACVEARVNIIISGATSSGKTTLLNVAASFIPARERIITIEDTAELQFAQAHAVRLEARPPDEDEKGEISIRQLLINALRMRPDRIIVGEARGAEVLDILQAMNTGHDGSLATVHSNGPRDTVRRMELMTVTSGLELSQRALRDMIAAAVELIVHVDRLRDGTRKITQITEINGMESDIIRMTDLFVLDQNAKGPPTLRATGLVPKFEHKFSKNNVALPKSFFAANL